MNSDRQQKVATANRLFQQMLFRYQGHIGAYLILGGVDFHGPHLFTIHAHGSASKVPYTAMGSGSLAAIAVLEENWKEKLQEEEAKKLVRDAILFTCLLSNLAAQSEILERRLLWQVRKEVCMGISSGNGILMITYSSWIFR